MTLCTIMDFILSYISVLNLFAPLCNVFHTNFRLGVMRWVHKLLKRPS